MRSPTIRSSDQGVGRTPGVNACLLTDDWGMQTALDDLAHDVASNLRPALSTAVRRGAPQWSAGRLSQLRQRVRDHGDLIDAGIDVIDPLQPEAMDLAVVAREYGGSVGFCGGISDQRLGTQTPSQVRDQIRWLIDTLGAPFGNAYVLAPSNSLMPEIPAENLEALFAACHDQ